MASRHCDPLFSEAFDGALDDPARHRFDDHLAGCPRCREGFADYAAAVQAVRELPAARMPVPVVIPASAPQLGPLPWWRARTRRPGWLRSPGPAVGGLALAAAGVAAVVVAVHAGHGGGAGSPLAGGRSGLSPANSGESAALAPASGGGAAALGPAALGAPCAPGHGAFAVPTSAGTGAPAGFDNAVRQSDPSRPGQQLILATTGTTYHAGQRVTVYARLLSSGSSTAIVPCVSLVGPPAAPAAEPPGAAGGAGAAAAPAPAATAAPPLTPVPPAAAEPTTAGPSGGAPLLAITVPPGLAPGTVLHLVAEVPAHVPDQPDATVEAVLTITVS